MVFRLLTTAVCLAWNVGACQSALAETPHVAGVAPADKSPDADASVRAALRLELDGKNTERNSLLRQALEQAPGHPQAHWQLGYVEAGGTWFPWERQIDDAGDRWQKLYLYRKSRSARGDTVDDHLYLANGARQHSMPDEDRAHLRRVVELDYDHVEARMRLGDVRIHGFWVTQDEILRFARELSETQVDRNAWDQRVQPIVRKLQRSRANAWEQHWQELSSICDPAAIPSVEAALAEGGERGAELYLDWLDGISRWEAAVALARQAVLAPSSAIRSSAQNRLRSRRIDHYAPVLLGALRADPSFRSNISITPFGGLLYTEECSLETQADHRARALAVLFGVQAIQITIRRQCPSTVDFLGTQNMAHSGLRETVISHLDRYYGGFDRQGGRDRESHVLVANERIMRTLTVATDIGVLESPQDWWDWWNDYQGVHSIGDKPRLAVKYEESWYVNRKAEIQRTATSVTRASCFAAGTPVVTEYGPKPIEEIQLGDRVLSQDVETGELAFKPVFKTTVRPPVALMKIMTDRGELLCTGGHPFWVNGESWLYARELQPGMRFHSVDGASEIVAAEDAGCEEQAYNLIVADFHTYFAGEGRVLSHDNTARAPTNALVPGLKPDYASVAKSEQ